MMRRRILLRCDGGELPEVGTGHVRRCLTLARELAAGGGNELAFLMRPTPWAGRVREAGHRVLELDPQGSLDEQLLGAARELAADVVVLDDLGRSVEAIAGLQAEGRIVVSIDDPRAPQLADAAINPAFPGLGASCEGLDCTILARDPRPLRRPEVPRGVLASFGGFDPEDLALRFLEAWLRADSGVECRLAVGRGHPRLDELRALAARDERAQLLVEAELAELLPRSELAVTGGGTTMFLAAALGVPALAVAQYEHQRDNAERLEAAGAAQSFGLAAQADFEALVAEARRLLREPRERRAMGLAGRRALPGFGRRDALQAITVVERLDWDSRFFGREIATLHPRTLTQRLSRFALEQCRAAGIECLYYLGQAEHAASRALAEAHGFRWVDDRLTYAIEVDPDSPPGQGEDAIRPGRASDAPALMGIAEGSYGDSRYFHDPGFPRALCQQFYRDWIRKSLAGRFDDVVLVAQLEGRVAGYVSCRALSANLGVIGLVGIDEARRGQGLGKRLVHAALRWFALQDLPTVEVVTQGRNAAAQGLYEACGFRLARREQWFHKWFDAEARA